LTQNVAEIEHDEQGRPSPPLNGDEASTLLGFLDFQRATLEWRCRGLGDDQLRITLAPSPLTLGGMLHHLAYVEDYWFSGVVAEQPTLEPWASVDWKADPDWDWHVAAEQSGETLRRSGPRGWRRPGPSSGANSTSRTRSAGRTPPGVGAVRCHCAGC
jgi:hypothetical protein